MRYGSTLLLLGALAFTLASVLAGCRADHSSQAEPEPSQLATECSAELHTRLDVAFIDELVVDTAVADWEAVQACRWIAPADSLDGAVFLLQAIRQFEQMAEEPQHLDDLSQLRRSIASLVYSLGGPEGLSINRVSDDLLRLQQRASDLKYMLSIDPDWTNRSAEAARVRLDLQDFLNRCGRMASDFPRQISYVYECLSAVPQFDSEVEVRTSNLEIQEQLDDLESELLRLERMLDRESCKDMKAVLSEIAAVRDQLTSLPDMENLTEYQRDSFRYWFDHLIDVSLRLLQEAGDC